MFNDQVTQRASVDGRACIRTRSEVGHVLYGPYQHVRPGIYRIDFQIALADARGRTDDPVCAIIDVAASFGNAVLQSRPIHLSQLSGMLATFSITLSLWEFRSLEYRVYVGDVVDLLIAAEPRVTQLSDRPETAPPPDPRVPTDDPVELNRQVRAVLALLRPYRAKGPGKVRLGNIGDGGYVCVDDFVGLDVALSFGINDDISWDLAVADRGLTVHQFDHTVECPAPGDPRMIFHKKMIAPASTAASENIATLVRTLDRRGARPNMILKMDIEGGEWPVIDATPADDLARFSQILCELHYFQGLADADYRRAIFDALSKLHEHYAVVHVHANVCGGVSNIANVMVPNVLEISFANRALYEFEDTDELFPGPMDISCDANQPDLFLGAFRF